MAVVRVIRGDRPGDRRSIEIRLGRDQRHARIFQIPPSLNYSRPNPEIDFPSTPFFVNTQLTPWASGNTPRRAGIMSTGMGGTNAHVVLEEAPRLLRLGQSREDVSPRVLLGYERLLPVKDRRVLVGAEVPMLHRKGLQVDP